MALNLNHIKDFDELRQMANLLVKENEKLHGRLAKLANEVDRLKGKDAATLQQEIAGLKQQLDRERSKYSQAKSERRRAHKRRKKKNPKPQTGGTRTPQPELPLEQCELTLGDEERCCSQCGGTAETLAGQYESGEMVTVVQRQFKVLRYRRQKYLRTCECDGPGKIVTAPPPLKVAAGGRYSLEFAATVALHKYHDQIPLNRQAIQMARQGLRVKPNVLWDQLYHLYGHLLSSYRAIHRAAFDEPVLGADETGWPMLEKGRKLWQVRCLTSARLSYFRIVTQKDTKSALELLSHPEHGYFAGTLMTDGAAAYDAARREAQQAFKLANCWAHARRKLLQAEPNFPAATAALDLIDALFAVERDADEVPQPERDQRRAELRRERSAVLLHDLRAWMNGSATAWDGSDLNKAIRYIDNRWKKLNLFLEDPKVPLHNNASEFALRRPVLGRKNYYGAKSRLGTQVAALFYTLLETARKNGKDPLAYLVTAAQRAIRTSDTATLPWDLDSS